MVVKAREDESGPGAILGIASAADALGYGEVWVGEGPTWDAFALAAAVGSATRSVSLTVGPVAVSVRDPATIARGAASVARLTGRPVGVALGTSSVRVVEKLHSRSRHHAVSHLRESARAIRELIDISPESRWSNDPDEAFLRRLDPPNGPITVAAFGDRAIQVAADYADRILLDLVTPEQVSVLRSRLELRVDSRPKPNLAAWLPVAVEPTDEALHVVLESIAGYLSVSGYREMFLAAGFQEAVSMAESGADIGELIAALPDDAPRSVGLVGSQGEIAERLQEYSDAGLDEVAIVPVTAGEPNGETTLRALRALV